MHLHVSSHETMSTLKPGCQALFDALQMASQGSCLCSIAMLTIIEVASSCDHCDA